MSGNFSHSARGHANIVRIRRHVDGFHTADCSKRYDANMLPRLLLLLALPLPLIAQTVTGTLEGHITDTSGAAIGGVRITAKNADTGLARSTAANENGYYQLTFLPIGDYAVTAEQQGFGALQRAAVVGLNASRTVDFKMKVATLSTEVTVEAAASQLDTTSGTVSASIDRKAIEDRPLSSRNILCIA